MEEKVKQVIIIRKDQYSKVRSGKLMAQCAHATLKVFTDKCLSKLGLVQFQLAYSSMLEKWAENGYRKIVVSVKDEEELLTIFKNAEDSKMLCSLVIDNGITEFHGVKTPTAVAIGPDYDSVVDKITGHLKLM